MIDSYLMVRYYCKINRIIISKLKKSYIAYTGFRPCLDQIGVEHSVRSRYPACIWCSRLISGIQNAEMSTQRLREYKHVWYGTVRYGPPWKANIQIIKPMKLYAWMIFINKFQSRTMIRNLSSVKVLAIESNAIFKSVANLISYEMNRICYNFQK